MVDYREAARPRDYREEFPEAYYDVDDEGNIDIVLRQAADASEKDHGAFSQVVYLRAFWTPIPGRTVADATQINACVSYMVIGAGFGAAFEGAGALFFKQNRRGDEIKGKLERASLRPVRALRGASPPFDRTELSGEFRAVRDRRRVSRIVNEMNREFGPLPPYPPSPRTAAGN